MSNDRNNASTFQQRVKSKKLLLLLVAFVVCIIDAAVAIWVISAGLDLLQCILPIGFVVADLLLIAAVFATNFRFRYSMTVPILYISATLLMAGGVMLGQGYNTFTVPAFVLFASVHAFPCLAFAVAARNAVHYRNKFRRHVAAAVIFAGLCCVTLIYGVFVLTSGIYGQGGMDTRSIIFTLNSDGSGYTARAVLGGKGTRVTIPTEFRGKPVTEIDREVFLASHVEEIYIESAADVSFLESDGLASMTAAVYLDKSELDAVKERLAALSDKQEGMLALCNHMYPCGLEENEVFITFVYDADSLQYTDYKLIPTWFGQAGDVFSLAEHGEGIYYAEGYDPLSEAFLYKSYQNSQKVLAPLMSGGEDIDGLRITSSISDVSVRFDNVYEISVSEDNDTVYNMPADYLGYEDTGYRYITATTAPMLLASAPTREGFDLAFEYTVGLSSVVMEVTSPTALLRDNGLTLHPRWTMQLPVIEALGTNQSDNSFVYGDDVSLHVAATKATDAMTLSYEWMYGNASIAYDAAYTLVNVLPSQSGVYAVSVTASAPEISSLTASVMQTVVVNIGKRTIDCVWTLPADTVYSGTAKSISAAPEAGDLINGDTVTILPSLSTVCDANTYALSATIAGAENDLYQISAATDDTLLTITPREVTLSWGTATFVYGGVEYCPTADVLGVGDESATPIELRVDGAARNAGRYTAVATSLNANYTFANAEMPYEITAREITLIWDESTTVFEYDGQPHSLRVNEIDGEVDGEEALIISALSYSGAARYAAESITMRATSPNTNYVVVGGATASFSITPKQLTIVWPDTMQLTYNGAKQHPTVTFENLVGTDNPGVSYTAPDNAVHVGSYSVTVAISNPNYKLDSGDITQSYDIVARALKLYWANTSLTFKGEAQHPNVSNLTGYANGERDMLLAALSYEGAEVNAGENYTARALLPIGSDYYIESGETTAFVIHKKALTLRWDTNNSFIYDGNPHTITATAQGLCNEDTVTLTYSDNGGNVTAGVYEIVASVTHQNYTVASTAARSGYTIEKKSLTLDWPTGRAFAYDGGKHTITPTVNGLVGTDTVTLTYSDNGGNVNAGTHRVTASLVHDNYKLTGTVTGTYTIIKIALTLTWPTGTSFVYDGDKHTVVPVINGLIGTDTVTLTYSDNGGNRNVGTYTVYATLTHQNYTLNDTVGGTYEITPAALTLTWPTGTSFVYDGGKHTVVPVINGLAEGDSVTLTYSDNGGNRNVGIYTVYATLTHQNYTLNDTEGGTYEITPAALTLTWPTGMRFTYDGGKHTVVPVINGLAEGDSVTLTYSDDGNSNVGTYTVYATLTHQNYTLNDTVGGTYEIIPAVLTLTWPADTEFVVDGTEKTFVPTVSGAVSGDELLLDYVYANAGGQALPGAPTEVGRYSVTVTVGNTNYTISEPTAAFSVVLPVAED